MPQCEVDASIGDASIFGRDYQSRITSQALRTIQYSLNGSQTLIVLVNQVKTDSHANSSVFFFRDKVFWRINVKYLTFISLVQVRRKQKPGSDRIHEETCGGNALKFYAAVRLQIRKTGVLQIGDEVIMFKYFLSFFFRALFGELNSFIWNYLLLYVCLFLFSHDTLPAEF